MSESNCECVEMFSEGSRRHAICTGEAAMPLGKINTYRAMWGLRPLPDDGRERPARVIHDGKPKSKSRSQPKAKKPCQTCGKQKAPVAPKPIAPRSGIGDRLHEIITREVGVNPCGECGREIKRLNELTVAQVSSERESIAQGIVERAKDKAPHWWQRWGATLAPGLAIPKVLDWIDEACVKSNRVPITRIVVAVRTAARQEPTLAATLESLANAGFERPIVFGEPNAPSEVDVRWETHRGSFRAFTDHAQWLLGNTDSRWFLLCEDDVQFAEGAADRLRECQLNDEILTLFKPKGLRIKGDGLQQVSAVNGSLAVLVNRETLVRLLESRTVKEWPRKDCVDRMIGRAAKEIGVTVLSPTKSWVQHTGQTSVCQPRKWKRNSLTHSMRIASDFKPGRIAAAGLVTLITPTGDRQEAFRLCERWISQQSYTGEIQWIVVDDGRRKTNVTQGQEYVRRKRGLERHSLCANLRAAIPLIRGQHVLVIEDDDYYGPDYISMMVGELQHADLVGEVGAKYYYLRHKSWRHRTNESWASLCRTGFNANVIPMLKACCGSTNHPSIDLRLWERWDGSRFSWVDGSGDFRGCVGIKGVNGRQSRGWKPARDAVTDDGLKVLKRWVGEDWTVYREAYSL
jgi:hypothetical protein